MWEVSVWEGTVFSRVPEGQAKHIIVILGFLTSLASQLCVTPQLQYRMPFKMHKWWYQRRKAKFFGWWGCGGLWELMILGFATCWYFVPKKCYRDIIVVDLCDNWSGNQVCFRWFFHSVAFGYLDFLFSWRKCYRSKYQRNYFGALIKCFLYIFWIPEEIRNNCSSLEVSPKKGRFKKAL